jgi:hypothetical protein
MSISYFNYAAEADKARKDADAAYYRARKYARDAGLEYRNAANYAHYAQSCTRRTWDDCAPGFWEDMARLCIRRADHLLADSFRETEWARSRAASARRYDQMASA